MRPTTPLTTVLVAVALAAPLAGCGAQPLAQRDPAGYKACQLLVTSRDADTPVMTRAAAVLTGIGSAAKNSTTSGIRSSAAPGTSRGEDLWTVDEAALAKVCAQEGIDVPAPLPGG